jgi:hypothetical protein
MTESAILKTLQLQIDGPDRVEIASVRARSVSLSRVSPDLIVRESTAPRDRCLTIKLVITPPWWQFWRKRTEVSLVLHSTPDLALPEIPLAHFATPLTDEALLGEVPEENEDDDGYSEPA